MTTIETTEIEAVVTLSVAPKAGQSLDEAGAQMFTLFREYITEREYNFLSDYGATKESLIAYRQDPEEAEPTWGGYEGPFVLAADVREADEPVSKGAAWHREIGDSYAKIALESTSLAVKTANASEAAKYYAIAERIEARSASSV